MKGIYSISYVVYSISFLAVVFVVSAPAQTGKGVEPKASPSQPQSTTTTTDTVKSQSNTQPNPPTPTQDATTLAPASESGGITFEPSTFPDFGEHDLNTISDAKKLTLKNSTKASVTIVKPVVTDDFIVTGNGCGTTIPPGGCQISLAFRPIHSGEVSGLATITGADGKNLASIPLTGKGFTPADCGLCKKSQGVVEVIYEFLPPFIVVILFIIGVILVRWNMIAQPTRRLLEAQIDSVKSRLDAIPASASDTTRRTAINDLLTAAKKCSQSRGNPLDWVFWARGQEMAGWNYVHEAQEQISTLLPEEQVRAQLESSQASLHDLNTPTANAIAVAIQEVLGAWSPAADDVSNLIQQSLAFLTAQYSLVQRARSAPTVPPVPGDPFSTLPGDIQNDLIVKANQLLQAINAYLTARRAPPDSRQAVLDKFRSNLTPLVTALDNFSKQVPAAPAAIPPAAWTALINALSSFAASRPDWMQDLFHASEQDLPEHRSVILRGRASLREALHLLHDKTDTELSVFASWHNKGFWLTGCSLLLIVCLAGVLQNGVLFLVGGLGGLLSRLNRELKRAEFPTDYGASWMTLFLSPVVGALTGWAGVLLVVIGRTWGILGGAINVDWCHPCAPLTLGAAVAFGFSERMFDTVISQLEERVAAQKAQSSATGPAPLKITPQNLPSTKIGADYTASLTASGGTQPYTWTSDLALPFKLDANGAITGKPAAEGTVTFKAVVTDKAQKTDTKTFTISVSK